MPIPELLPPERQIVAVQGMWNVVRTCELNVLFHREKAKIASRRAKAIDNLAALLAAIAGIGILAGIGNIPDSTWAIVAFCSGLAGQLRPVFGLPNLELEHRKLQNDYGSVLSSIKGVLDQAKDAGGLTYELDAQRRLTQERFNFVMERDETDYDPEELRPIQHKINQIYPADRLWLPPKQTIPFDKEIE
jgi:hypothetical protein